MLSYYLYEDAKVLHITLVFISCNCESCLFNMRRDSIDSLSFPFSINEHEVIFNRLNYLDDAQSNVQIY